MTKASFPHPGALLLALSVAAFSGCGGGSGDAPPAQADRSDSPPAGPLAVARPGDPATAPATDPQSANQPANGRSAAAADRKLAQVAVAGSAVFAQLDPAATFKSLGWNAGLVCNGRDIAFANLAETGLSGNGVGSPYGALRFAKVNDPRHPQRKVYLMRANVNDANLTGSPNCVVGWPPGGSGGLPVGETFWLTFGLHLPSWTTVPEESVIAQWHQAGPSGQPLMALSAKGGQLVLTVRHNASATPSPATNTTQVYTLPGSLPVGDWTSIVIKARISADGTQAPFLTLWRDGQQLVDHRGPVGYRTGAEKPFAMLGLDTWGHASGPNKWSAGAPTKAVLLARPTFVKDTGGSYTEADLRAHVAPAGTPIGDGPTGSWVKVADEFQTFTVSGTQTVRYGHGSTWVEKQLSGTVYCGNSTFGDPLVGQRKQCELKQAGVDLRLKPFASNSPWNTPIPANATYAPATDSRVRDFRGHGSPINVMSDWYTQWVWYAKPTDPLVTINVSALNLDSNRGKDYWIANARPGNVSLRMPADAHPDPGRGDGVRGTTWTDFENKDAHITIIDPDGKTSHEFYHAEKDAATGAYKALAYARVPLDGLGVNMAGEGTKALIGSYWNPDFLTYGWGPARAYGGSSLGGLIRAGEITGGSMNHALALLLPFEILGRAQNDIPLWPATRTEYHDDYRGTTVLGTRFAIPRSVNIESLGLTTAAGRTLARTLQQYGAFVVDSAGSINLNADGVAAQPDAAALRAAGPDLARIKAAMTIVNP